MRISFFLRRTSDRSTGRAWLPALILVCLASGGAGARAAERQRDPFQGDTRLQGVLTVRVSRMPIAALLQRIGDEVGVRLTAGDEDVGDQKVDLFTHGKAVPAAEILTAITRMLNAECPPRGYLWQRSGESPDFCYDLARDVASRQWETQRAADAEARLPRLLRERFAALTREPFRAEASAPLELPGMRKLLPTLTEAQLRRLCTERFLVLTAADCTPGQKQLLGQLVDELVAYQMRRWPERTQAALAQHGAQEKDKGRESDLEVVLQGRAPRYLVRVGVGGPATLGQSSDLCPVVDTETLAGSAAGGRGPVALGTAGVPEPMFALPPRTQCLMGDVLADIAARANINLVADDYTQQWPQLGRMTGPRSLSAWLTVIRDEFDFEPAREGSFVRLRNRAWWLDRRREIPSRLLTRWQGLLRGANADRLRMMVEVAQRVPFSRHPRVIGDRMQALHDSPEVAWTVRQDGPRSVLTVTDIVAIRQLELLLYDRLTAEQQRTVLGTGLKLRWEETPEDWRAVWARQFRHDSDREEMRGMSMFLRYEGDRLQMDRDFPALSIRDNLEAFLPAEPADDPRQLVGRLLPELEVEEASGKASTLRPRGPMLLYVTPGWPRPVVARPEPSQDLKALAAMSGFSTQAVGTEATASELLDWWKERGLGVAAPALRPDSAQRLGISHLPLAIVVDREGRVTWVREGYAAGDEAEWRRQVGRAGG